MKLSEAMMLGSVTCIMKSADIDTCALGAACNAVGIPKQVSIGDRFAAVARQWPWTFDHKRSFDRPGTATLVIGCEAIWSRFDCLVCRGKMSLEQLVDYVRSIEPSCGDCNRFECSCVKSEAAPVAEEVTA